MGRALPVQSELKQILKLKIGELSAFDVSAAHTNNSFAQFQYAIKKYPDY